MMIKLKSLSIFLGVSLFIACSSEDSDTNSNDTPIPEDSIIEESTTPTKPAAPTTPVKPEPVEPEPVELVKYAPGSIIFEPEITKSNLGLWVVRKPGDPNYYDGGTIKPINDSYLEFTGNNLNSGNPTSPLEYKFTCKKTAKYRLVGRMYQPLKDCIPKTANCGGDGHELEDKRNDIFIKLKGNFTTDGAYPQKTLETNHKFFGRGVRKWGSFTGMDAHVNGKKTLASVFYNLIEGEEYTFTISGRAQGCSIDYFMLNDVSNKSLNIKQHDDPAAILPEAYRPDVKQ